MVGRMVSWLEIQFVRQLGLPLAISRGEKKAPVQETPKPACVVGVVAQGASTDKWATCLWDVPSKEATQYNLAAQAAVPSIGSYRLYVHE